jgi:hypothetical protein
MTTADELDNLNADTTYTWHYLADKNGIGHEASTRWPTNWPS